MLSKEMPILKIPKIQAFVGPMASGKTNKLIQILNASHSFSQHGPNGKHLIIGIKNNIDNRTLNNSETSEPKIESRISQYPAVITNTPFDWLNKQYSANKSYILGMADAQFFSYEQLKKLIEFVKAKSNIFLILEGLDLNFRGEPFPHSDFLGTMEDTLGLIPDENVHHLTAFCNFCRREGAQYTIRMYEKDGNLIPVPVYDKLVRVGSDALETNEDDKILGIKNPKISYGACHKDEFESMQKQSWITEWKSVNYYLELYGRCNKPFRLGEIRDIFKPVLPQEVYGQIVQRLLEERVITVKDHEEEILSVNGFIPERNLERMMGEQTYWIKQY